MYWNADSTGWGWWAWFSMAVFMFAFLALIGGVIWFAVRRSSAMPMAEGTQSAEETLRLRYAAGELDDEEFARRMRVLREASLTRS